MRRTSLRAALLRGECGPGRGCAGMEEAGRGGVFSRGLEWGRMEERSGGLICLGRVRTHGGGVSGRGELKGFAVEPHQEDR